MTTFEFIPQCLDQVHNNILACARRITSEWGATLLTPKRIPDHEKDTER